MAPFGLIFAQDGSHGLWEASGMPPGTQNRQKTTKIRVFGFWVPGAPGALWVLICPLKAVADIFDNPKRWLDDKRLVPASSLQSDRCVLFAAGDPKFRGLSMGPYMSP